LKLQNNKKKPHRKEKSDLLIVTTNVFMVRCNIIKYTQSQISLVKPIE
jgi:hypothetical protein